MGKEEDKRVEDQELELLCAKIRQTKKIFLKLVAL